MGIPVPGLDASSNAIMKSDIGRTPRADRWVILVDDLKCGCYRQPRSYDQFGDYSNSLDFINDMSTRMRANLNLGLRLGR